MNQDFNAAEEVNPFVKRVTSVRLGDVVIFKYQGMFRDQQMVDDIQEQFAKKMGDIAFLVIDDHFDLTVLKQSAGAGIHIA